MQLLLNDVVKYKGDAWKFTNLVNKGKGIIVAEFDNLHKSPLHKAHMLVLTQTEIEKFIDSGEMESETEPGKVSSSVNTKKRVK